MKILVFLNSYLPGFKSGGPVRTIENMAKSLPGHEFSVVTTDRDLGDSEPYQGITRGVWTKTGDSEIYYLNEKITLFARIVEYYKLLKSTSFDVLYLQSFFNVRFTMLPLVIFRLIHGYSKPVVIAPRGEFSKGAISLKSWKKKPYVFLIKFSGLLKNITWQASTEAEHKDILDVLSKTTTHVFKADNIFIAPDIGSLKVSRDIRKSSSDFKVIFVSRITKKKNLSFLLDCLSHTKISLILNIYGPIEDEKYWSECKRKIDNLPTNVVANYLGSVDHSEISSLFSQHDLFFFPTLGENFGHVIIESLASGTPVLISDQTPWSTDKDGACTALPLNRPDLFNEVLLKFAKHTTQEKDTLAMKAIELAQILTGREVAIEKNNALFEFSKANNSRSRM